MIACMLVLLMDSSRVLRLCLTLTGCQRFLLPRHHLRAVAPAAVLHRCASVSLKGSRAVEFAGFGCEDAAGPGQAAQTEQDVQADCTFGFSHALTIDVAWPPNAANKTQATAHLKSRSS